MMQPMITTTDKQVPLFCLEEDPEDEDFRIHDKSLDSGAMSTAEVSQAPISFGILVTRPVAVGSKKYVGPPRNEQVTIKALEAAFERHIEKALTFYRLRKVDEEVKIVSEKNSIVSTTPTVTKNMFPTSEIDDLFYLEGKYNLDFADFDPPFWIPEGIHDMEEFKSLTSDFQWKRPVSEVPAARAEHAPTPDPVPAPPEPVQPAEQQEFCAEETQSQTSRASTRTRGSYNMLALTERMKIVNHSLSHGVEETCKQFNLSRSRVKRYIKNGVVRKTGGGRKTLDPHMEELLLGWIECIFALVLRGLDGLIEDNTRENGIFPAKFQIKAKAVELTTVSHFRGSKGWCDKFLKRNQPRLDIMREMYVR